MGAGVSGLTCAVSIQEEGYPTRIVTAALPTETTSMMAAAVWTVPGTAPGSRSFEWALASRARFSQLAQEPASGVSPLVQRELETEPFQPYGWEDRFPWIRTLDPDEAPPGYSGGWHIDGFLIDPTVYLPWLQARFEKGGGTIDVRLLGSLQQAEADVVVNCTGLGARELCGDLDLLPVRGQVVAVRAPAIREGVSYEGDPERIRYVYPRRNEVILGGTREAGRDDLTPDPQTTERILKDCQALVPELEEAEVIESRVGIRPGRSEVRLESERLADDRPVIHNYGHGGQGFLLSWGCADEVLSLVQTVVDRW
ncbi:MAG TPA: FAD-dependent oxidoreductase [Acidimicrobiia bacterium]|nr:FAD-dependent oxidoreductase [Acidimicrobiia bacterium]